MNRKSIASLLTATFLILLHFTAVSKEKSGDAMDVIRRFSDGKCENVRLHLTDDKTIGTDWFRTEVKNGILHIYGNSNVSLCRGFYETIKDNSLGMLGWNGKRCEIPQSWDGVRTKKTVSPFGLHYYMNVCTFGYSAPYWDWERWEQEIDWMALHGIDMPLALVANEAISARVWKRLGMSDKEINEYFAGPAHLPWMRMGNISHHDGPLSENWHNQQVALQHKILERMRELGMNPICPAFAGFVPKTITRLYPELKLAETVWGTRFRNWMIDPKDPLFFEIGKMFIEEWEKEFGKCKYYLADSFNEMEIPFPPIGTQERYEMLRLYGDRLYQSIHAGNKDAVWVMQGWMFGYDREIWEPRTLEALLEKVPDDGIILLDLAANYNKYEWKNEYNWDYYKGFFNTTWIYSVIPNMGGKSTVSGCLDFFANNHLLPLSSQYRGQLCGTGLAPEGIESNEVVFELITDAGWRDRETDVTEWLDSYSTNRYGFYDKSIRYIWDEMRQSVYAGYVSHPRFNWMYRPGSVRKGSVNVNEHLFNAAEALVRLGKEKSGNILMKSDAIEWTALYAGHKMELLVNKVQDALYEGRTEEARKWFATFEELALKADRLMTSHPHHRAEKWVEYARKAGTTSMEKDHYEMNAKRIITVWGPPVDDYASRLWSGVLRDYYVPRWKKWFEMRLAGQYPDTSGWEVNWVENSRGFSECKPYADVWEGAEDVIALCREIPENLCESGNNILGDWFFDYSAETKKELHFNVEPKVLEKMKGIEFVPLAGSNPLKIEEIQVILDGKVVKSITFSEEEKTKVGRVPIVLDGPESSNNGCKLKISVKTKGRSAGRVTMLTEDDKGLLSPGRSSEEVAELTLGLIADPQYADADSRGPRKFRSSLGRLEKCIGTFNETKVDFTICLGDLTDRNPSDLDTVITMINRSDAPVYHLTGNHDYRKVGDMARIVEKLGMPALYYSIVSGRWKFILLDSNDISSYSHPGDGQRAAELSEMKSRILSEGRSNDRPWNGGVGKEQMEWLENELDDCREKGLYAVVFAHHPIWPAGADNCLNDTELAQFLSSREEVRAFVSGHHHPGNFAMFGNLPCITLEGMVEAEGKPSFAIMKIYPDRITVRKDTENAPGIVINLI